MTNARRFQLDELVLRPGTYFNPQTEIMVVVDDSPEVDHEIFESDDFESTEWVLIAEDVPIDDHTRDDLVERFQRTHQGDSDDDVHAERDPDDDVEDDEDDEDDDELDDVDDIDFERD
jgi:hypothetical protein